MRLEDKILTLLWAKKKDVAGQFVWLPLLVHLQDTMGVMQFLWYHWVSEGQKQTIIHSLSPVKMDAEDAAYNLACFLAGVHDIGKCTPVFQTQTGYQNSPDLDITLIERLELAGLTGISTISKHFDAASRKRTHHTILGEYLLGCFGVKQDISSIIGAHHGKPVDTEDMVTDLKAYTAYCYQEEQGRLKNIWMTMQKSILNKILKETGFVDSKGEGDVSFLPEVSEPGQVLLSGLIIMADWIASNETYFPLLPLEEKMSLNMQERLQYGMRIWHRINPVESTDMFSIADLNEYYSDRFDFLPLTFQQVVFDTIEHTENPGIFILEAPMGSGKTEAALTIAEELMAKKKLDGLFFGLPTQATSNGIFPRINDWLKKMASEYEKMETLKLMHGKAALNTLQEELLDGVYVDEDLDSGVLTSQWFAGRKTAILSDAVVGTVDHFLLMALKQKHLALRHLGFSKKIVIIDEVHAYDAYMDIFLSRAIEWMGAYEVPVILLSATLPAEIRANLIQAYLLGQGKGIRKREKEQHAPIFQSEAYPLLTYTDNGAIKQEKIVSHEKEKCIAIERLEEEHLEELLKTKINYGGVVGIIVNTVRRAQQFFERLSKIFGNDVTMLHAKFIDTDRIKKEDALMQRIGKNAKRPYRAIVIGTQVLEQSLDIDFDMLVTDLCPIDLLLQRVGRLHRHTIPRPEELSKPTVYVMGQSDTLEFEKGASAIYGEYLLARTQQILPSQEIFLPRDISPLVQRVYGREELSWQGELQETYEKAKENYEIVVQKKSDKAQQQFLLQKPHLKIKPEKYNLIGWLNTHVVSDSEENAFAQVRDAEESIEVIAVMQYGTGYGFFNQKEDISDQIENNNIAKEIAKQTLKLSALDARYAFGSVHQTIEWLEAYNRKNLLRWQKQPWLKGSLGIVFEPTGDGETGTFHLGDVVLLYNCHEGLQVQQIKK